jgi:monoamine oxidase
MRKAVEAGVSITFDQTVNRIQWKNGRVVVTTASGSQFDAEKILIAVPVSILQKEQIMFEPQIPEYISASRNIGYGGVIKFLFEFHKDFWEDVLMKKMKNFRFIFSDAPIPTWWSQLPDRIPLLTGWLGGPDAFSAPHENERLLQMGLNSIGYLFKQDPGTIRNNISSWHIADWVADPWSLGAYAYALVSSAEARKKLMMPVESTLYFAGEALYEGPAMGTVEAALSSGQEAAKMIIASRATQMK